MQIEYHLKDVHKVARKIARQLHPGDVVGLVGELAAGKTTLTQALLKHWGYDGLVSSPTFVIEHRYPIESENLDEVIHLDFYRLSSNAADQFDWAEYIGQPRKITLIEWPTIVAAHLPEHLKIITLEKVNEKTRRLTLSDRLSR